MQFTGRPKVWVRPYTDSYRALMGGRGTAGSLTEGLEETGGAQGQVCGR